MRDHIIEEDYELWDIVTDGPMETTKKNAEGVDVPKTRADCTAEDLKKWEKNAKAKKWLVCGVGPDEYNRIQSYTTAKEIWDTLQVAHEGTSQVKRSRGTLLYSQYENFSMKEEESIQEMYTRRQVEKILTRVLLVTLESKITAIQESRNIATLKLDELIGNLTAYELRRPTMKMDAPKKERSLALRIAEGPDLEYDEMAMITRDFKKYLMRGKGSSRGTTFNKPRVPEKQTNEGCYGCGKTDHIIKNCPQWEIEWKKERAERRNMKKEHVQPKRNKGSIKAMVVSWGETSDKDSEDEVQVKGSSQIRYMDSGCSKHMTGSKNRGNLVAFTIPKCFVINLTTDKIVLQGKRVNNIYIVDLSTLSENELTCLSVLDSDTLLWHKRLGHASLNQINKLVSKDLVIGLPNIKSKEDKVCEACAREKHVRSSFKNKKMVSTTKMLELVHMDLRGPTKTMSRGGKKYVMVLVDDYSRFTWVLFLTSKDEEFGMFTIFVRKTQKQLDLVEKTPYECFVLCAFGCKCFVHNNGKDSLVFDETNILYERQEYEDEAIRLVKDFTKVSAQVKVVPKEGTGDGTGPSI
ncbi:uncharacterized protein [Nicotiana sylvestris]|uniref:uncharacterized protein n=1 Tax=Nicotiana sylvestris TaxID=4096 RepID=UPI00388C7088